ncbi:MAG TPA: CHAT domain-containing protein [Solirubrobacteraceae bacterium]|nr:CHAT domain-containing protein [Solirubrobacteraceae bacterium]
MLHLEPWQAHLPASFLTDGVLPMLSTDAQLYLACAACHTEWRADPETWRPDRPPACAGCGARALVPAIHAWHLETMCAECEHWFERTDNLLVTARCPRCGSTKLTAYGARFHEHPETFRDLLTGYRWGVDVDADLTQIINETEALKVRPHGPRHVTPLILLLERLEGAGAYGADADRSLLTNARGLLLRELFRLAGVVTAGMEAVRVLETAADRARDVINRALREHNVAMAVFSLLAWHPHDSFWETAMARPRLRAAGTAAGERALAIWQDLANQGFDAAPLQIARVSHVLGDLASVGSTDELSARTALEHYNRALAQPGVDARTRFGLRSSRLVVALTPSGRLLLDAGEFEADLEAVTTADESDRRFSDRWRSLGIKGRYAEQRGDDEGAQAAFEESAALALDEISKAFDEQSLVHLGERYVRVFDELARFFVRTGRPERALGAIETVRAATVRTFELKPNALYAGLAELLGLPPTHTRQPALELVDVVPPLAQAPPDAFPADIGFLALSWCGPVVSAVIVQRPEGSPPICAARQWTASEELIDALAAFPDPTAGPFREQRLRAHCRVAFEAMVEPLMPLLRESGIRRLAVSAPGPLSHLPFEAFGPGKPTPDLGDEFEVFYLPSLSLGMDLAGRGRLAAAPRLLLIAYPGTDLPATRREITQLAEGWPGEVTVLDEASATRNAVIDELTGGYSFIHFACHGTFDPLRPLRSALHLAASTERESQTVSADDLRRLDLRATAPAVTLSACSSALTSYGPTNDCTGLTGSFLRAGASAVVGSRWPVYDRVAADFMRRLYAALPEHDYAIRPALHRVQRDVREADDRVENWAAFSYLGTPSAAVRAVV